MKRLLLPTFVLLAAFLAAPIVSGADPVPSAYGTVYLHDNPFHVAPEQFDVRTGQIMRLYVFNQGSQEHNLVVCGDGTNQLSTCKDRWGFTPNIQPNQQANVTFTAMKPGRFDLFCDLPGHKAGGMRAILVVTGELATTKDSPSLPLIVALVAIALVAFYARRT